MRYKFLIPLVALKILLFGAWFLSDHFDTARVYAQTQAGTPVVDMENLVSREYMLETGEKEVSMIAAIKRREAELDDRGDKLQEEEKRLTLLKNDIDKRINELNKISSELAVIAEKVDMAKSARVKKTIKIYESMAPEEAAVRIERLKESMAVIILANMNAKKAGAILGLVEVNKAVKLTHLLKIKTKQ